MGKVKTFPLLIEIVWTMRRPGDEMLVDSKLTHTTFAWN